jgi:hypothetical protein
MTASPKSSFSLLPLPFSLMRNIDGNYGWWQGSAIGEKHYGIRSWNAQQVFLRCPRRTQHVGGFCFFFSNLAIGINLLSGLGITCMSSLSKSIWQALRIGGLCSFIRGMDQKVKISTSI